MNLIDIIVILFVAAVTIISAKKGFIKSLLNLSAYAIAGIVSKMLAAPVGDYCYDKFLKVKVLDEVTEILPSGSVSGEITSVINSTLSALPGFVSSLAEQFGINASSDGTNELMTVAQIESEYIAPVVSGVLGIIAFVFLFILFAIIFRIIFSVVDKFLNSDKHKLIRNSNRILGALLGFIKSLPPAGLVCAVLNIAAPVINNEAFNSLVAESFLCRFVANI